MRRRRVGGRGRRLNGICRGSNFLLLYKRVFFFLKSLFFNCFLFVLCALSLPQKTISFPTPPPPVYHPNPSYLILIYTINTKKPINRSRHMSISSVRCPHPSLPFPLIVDSPARRPQPFNVVLVRVGVAFGSGETFRYRADEF